MTLLTDPAVATLRGPGLSSKLLLLTLCFVMLAEILIFVPSIANFRRNWLEDKVGAASTAALVIEAAPEGMVPPEVGRKLLLAVGASSIAIRSGAARKPIASVEPPPIAVKDFDLRDVDASRLIRDAFGCLLAPEGRMIRIVGSGMEMDSVEVIMDEGPLREAMLRFSVNILVLSLIISAITAALVYLALSFVIVRPVRRLAENMAAFEADPEDTRRIVPDSGRGDEIGVAERALAGMERKLADELRRNRRLAMLGLAVAKISHDLRNILTAAQLLSDRIAALPDPTVQKFAPRLFDAVGRAVALCESTLSYGRAAETPPQLTSFPLRPLAEEVGQLVAVEAGEDITLAIRVAPELRITADRDQLFRILLNLMRNAAHILARPRLDGRTGGLIEVGADADADRVTIDVADDGPGVPPHLRPRLFEPFSVTTSPNGAGLGLAIASELARGHGGALVLVEDGPGAGGAAMGARFRVSLPRGDAADPNRP